MTYTKSDLVNIVSALTEVYNNFATAINTVVGMESLGDNRFEIANAIAESAERNEAAENLKAVKKALALVSYNPARTGPFKSTAPKALTDAEQVRVDNCIRNYFSC